MAIDINRVGWLPAFLEERETKRFLSNFFTMKRGGSFSGTKVAIDVKRFGEDVATVVKRSTGPNLNDVDVYTTKEFTPPSYDEAIQFKMDDLLARGVGVDPFTAAYVDYMVALIDYMVTGFAQIDAKIQRAVEIQASQVLQTGKLDLKDKNGVTTYKLDYKPKAAHFPDVTVSWSSTSSTKEKDLLALAKVIRGDCGLNCNILIMGETALSEFINDSTIQALADNRRIELINISPSMKESGATFYGVYKLGTYEFQLWAYPGTYKDPETGDTTEYVGTSNVIMLSDKTRLDMVASKVVQVFPPDPRVASLIPSRLVSRDAGLDITPNVYLTPNGAEVMGELRTNPLLVPVQIDGFGTLNTVAP